MSWGVATQNGVSVSLASIVSLSCGATEFSPASLFTSGVAGAWYDPSDYSTLFQDSAGTTPVTAVEQPVGLMLDKSQGLVLGSELVTNGDFSNGTTGWTGASLTVQNGALNIGTSGGSAFQGSVYSAGLKIISGRFRGNGGSGYPQAYIPGAGGRAFNGTTSQDWQTFSGLFTSTDSRIFLYSMSGSDCEFDDISVKVIAGNHASQATAASRPVLRARYNQSTYSEQFNNAAWTKENTTITANAITAPDGTLTADAMFETVANSVHRVTQTITPGVISTITFSCYVQSIGGRDFNLEIYNGTSSGVYCSFSSIDGSLTSSGSYGTNYTLVGTPYATNEGNGWYRAVFTATIPAASSVFFVRAINGASSSYVGDVTKGLYLWGADFRIGSSAGTYQRIAAATDYATAGFLPYLYFVTDDSFGTNSIDFTATDKMSVVTGYTKLSDTAVGMLYELGIDPTTTNGTFNFVAPQSTVDGSYRINVRGTTTVQVNTAARAAPVTDVSSLQANIAGPSISLRLNGAVAASSTSSMGTGNFANSALYIGRRNNSNFPINGNFYQMVICGKTLSASELASTEAYVATKTGVTL